MGLVIATFIIAAIFVGYHASQEPREKTVEDQGTIIELEVLSNQAKQTTLLYINPEMSKSIL